MLQFVHQTRFPATPEAVFAFHERDDILSLLMPPWHKVQVISRTGGLKIGARVELRMLLGPFFVTWIAVHTGYEHNRLFVDEQQKGPMKYWRHQHIFQPDGDGCILRDEITYSLPFGLNSLLGRLVEKDLRRMFTYRHEVTARGINADVK
jgi:ligand-binding SRPBCC domain-containing protein